ncbi:hypothetical protein GCM10010330_35970 [Streptomyces tendae]|nr:hypothetical protein GCM10010330_35970 [Streptomyces tendae]
MEELILAGQLPRGSPVIVSTDNRRETLLRLTAEGRRTVEEVTARRRREIALIVERLSAQQRLALMDALAAFNTAGAEPLAPSAATEPSPLGWE